MGSSFLKIIIFAGSAFILLLTAFETSTVAQCVPAPVGVVSWWPGEGNGNDIFGPTYENGTLENGVTFSPGKVGQAFSFDGVDDYVEISDSPSLDLTRISMNFWFKLNELNRIHELVNKFGPEGSNTIAYGSEIGTDNTACFRLSTDGTLSGLTDVCSTTVLTPGVWYHFAGTYDGTAMKIYINGVNEATVAKTGDIFINTQNLKLGSYGYFPWFLNGYLDEVNLTDRALTPTEVTAIYNAGTFGICRECTAASAGAVGWWRAENTGYDFLGMNNGTLVNGAAFAPGKVGNAFIFDGVDDMVVVPDAPSLNFDPFEPMTIHMWAYPTENRAMHLIGKRSSCWDSGQTSNYQLYQDGAGFQFNSGGVNVSAAATPQMNEWQHVAVTFDGGYVRLYHNGSLLATQETALGGINNGAPVIIGGTCFDVGARFPGMLDEVTVLNSALNSAEIAAISNAGNAGVCPFFKSCATLPPDLIASWRAEGNAYDRRKEHDGTLLEGTSFDTGISGKAFEFDGANDYVHVPAFNMGADWTVEGWINPARCSDATHCTMVARSAGNFDGLVLTYLGPGHPDNNEFALYIGNGSEWQVSLPSDTKYGFGRWYHVAASKSGNTYTLFVDGVAVAQETASGVSTNYQDRDLTFGLWNYGTPAYLLGRIDDVAVYDRSLTSGELSAIHTAATTGLGKCGACQTIADMDGDMSTDLSIFRPSVGEWWFLRSSDGGNGAAQFGTSTDTIVPADYTGDGKTDIAFFRVGVWFVLRSDDFTYYSFPFGAATDIPAPADFDGDGSADAGIYRPATSEWFIYRSADRGITITTFGTGGDKPVPADYDGDGRADVAIFRPVGGSGAEWWYLRSIDGGNRAFTFGVATDLALPDDFTGDGKADLAFFRPAGGEWFVLRSEDYSFYSFPFGSPTDIPAPGDYDGDAIADAAVYRPATSTWYINASAAGTIISTFGTLGDRPLPNAFVR